MKMLEEMEAEEEMEKAFKEIIKTIQLLAKRLNDLERRVSLLEKTLVLLKEEAVRHAKTAFLESCKYADRASGKPKDEFWDSLIEKVWKGEESPIV